MKKLLLLSMLLLVAKTFSYAQSSGCEELLISEYIDGPFKNKALEIYNPTDSAINLAGYSVKIFENGAPTPVEIPLFGTLASKETYVVAHFQADSAVLSKADMVSPMMNFDGNDAIVLNKGQSTYIDKIGEIGVDPGNSGWFVPPNGSTKDRDLRRKQPVDKGETDWNNGKNQWEVHPKDSIANLKKHISKCALPTVSFAQTTSSYTESYIDPMDGSSIAKIEITISGFHDYNFWINILATPFSTDCAADMADWNNDFSLQSGSILVLANDNSSKFAEVLINNDANAEPDEAVCLELSVSSFDATVGNCCHKMIIANDDGSGINELIGNSIKINPVIANEEINVEGIENIKQSEISIINLLGQKVMLLSVKSNNKMKVDISTLETGVYFINIINDKFSVSRKFIKI